MKYNKTITLKDGRKCTLRNGEENDGEAVLANFIHTTQGHDAELAWQIGFCTVFHSQPPFFI